MENIETIRLITEILAYIAAVASIGIIAFQSRKEANINEFQLLQTLEGKFSNLLWRGDDNKNISNVWTPLSIEKNNRFLEITKNAEVKNWPLWNSIDQADQDCYRFTRSGLSIMEQAFLIHKQKWIKNPEIWEKWEGWMISWKQTNAYFPFVLEEVSNWYTKSFIQYLNSLPTK